MPKVRILSMDGGPAGPTYGRFLREIERKLPGFLKKTDVFAGVSDGASFASSFAVTPRGQRDGAAIERAIGFNERLFDAMAPSLLGLLRMSSGLGTATGDSEKLLRVFRDALGSTTFGQLREHGSALLLVTFRVKNPWGAKVYNSYPGLRAGGPPEPDEHVMVAEAAFQSGAFPVIAPIRNGHVDGGVFANNPSLCAVAQVFSQQYGFVGTESLDDIVCFSLGGDTRSIGSAHDQIEFRKKMAQWGWARWIADRRQVLLILELMVNAGDRGIAFQTGALLGPRHLRLAIPSIGVVRGLFDVLLHRNEDVFGRAEKTVAEWAAGRHTPGFRPTLDQTVEWLNDHRMPD
jgi:hypothetical protein